MQAWGSRKENILGKEQSKDTQVRKQFFENSRYPTLQWRVRIEEEKKNKMKREETFEELFHLQWRQRKQWNDRTRNTYPEWQNSEIFIWEYGVKQ